jgi:hypothetical protein
MRLFPSNKQASVQHAVEQPQIKVSIDKTILSSAYMLHQHA